MNNTIMPFTEKDLVAIKFANDYQNKKNNEFAPIVLEKIKLLFELINSLHADDIKVPIWMIWSEPLIQKLGFHSINLLKLFGGTEIPIEYQGKKIQIMDKPSIIVLLRVITENFLTFNYLYSDSVSDEEKQFRLSVWRYCGISQRIQFDLSTPEARKKQIEEAKLLEELKNEIINSPIYLKFNEKERKEIIKGKKPRLFNSWIDLIKQSGLRVKLFKNMYGYKSNYTHSEFISILQVKSGVYVYNPNANIEIELILLHIIIAKSIILLKNIFPSIKKHFEALDSKSLAEVEFINQFGSDAKLDDI